MPVSFNHVPNNVRIRGFYPEIDPSRAGNNTTLRRILVMGHKFSTGDLADNTLLRAGSADSIRPQAGRGSMLERQVIKARENNGFDDIWIIGVPEVTGNAATGTIEVTAAATAAGVIYLYIAGQRVSVKVAAGDTVSEIATAINAAINAALDLPVTSTVSTATVTLTARWPGILTNGIDIRVNHLGSLGGEALPSGVALTITAMSGGTGVPDLTDTFAALGDNEFETIINPWTDAAALNDIDDEWDHEGDNGRWGWLRQLYGHVWSAADGTYAELTTLGQSRNGPHQCTWGYYGSPNPSWERSAAFAAAAHRPLMNDPARPIGTIEVKGILAAKEEDRFSKQEKNSLLFDGISVVDDEDGTLRINQAITHYQINAYGLDDTSMLKVNTMYTYAYVVRSRKFHLLQRFPRHKIANDGTRFGPGQAITTPSGIKAELASHYAFLEFKGILENAQEALKNTIVERDVDNPDRVNILDTPDFINQLDVFAVKVQYRLQFQVNLSEAVVPTV